MNILPLGSGGREHAMAAKIAESKLCKKLFIAPGNAGTTQCGTNVDLKIDNFSLIGKFVIDNNIKMVVVGPEAPLGEGLVDALEKIGVKCAAPTQAAARIETSKTFMRELVDKYKIDGNLGFASFDNAKDAEAYVKKIDHEIVVKPVGLTCG